MKTRVVIIFISYHSLANQSAHKYNLPQSDRYAGQFHPSHPIPFHIAKASEMKNVLKTKTNINQLLKAE